MQRKIALGAILAASLMGFGAAAQAQFVVNIAPPAPQYEVVPAPRAGYVWDAGHYEWRNNQHVWVGGQWIAARNGYDYQARRWVQRGNGEWMLAGGNWERRGPNGDRDGDGIANRYDNHRGGRFGPNGDMDRDGIANQYDRDRDGDGVRNNRDRFPDDPRRS
jgi:opacity protein-like surface antigen